MKLKQKVISLYHGTSVENFLEIMTKGFNNDENRNFDFSKRGVTYFYGVEQAQYLDGDLLRDALMCKAIENSKTKDVAFIKVDVLEDYYKEYVKEEPYRDSKIKKQYVIDNDILNKLIEDGKAEMTVDVQPLYEPELRILYLAGDKGPYDEDKENVKSPKLSLEEKQLLKNIQENYSKVGWEGRSLLFDTEIKDYRFGDPKDFLIVRPEYRIQILFNRAIESGVLRGEKNKNVYVVLRTEDENQVVWEKMDFKNAIEDLLEQGIEVEKDLENKVEEQEELNQAIDETLEELD